MAEEELKPESEEVPQQPEVTAYDGPLAARPEDLTDRVVDEITRAETDEILKVQDEKVIEEFTKKPSFKEKLSNWFHSWWDVPKKRYTVLGLFVAFWIAIFAFPTTRYAVLNTVGVRASVSIQVLDESTSQPLKNVAVTVHGQTATTDIDGNATLSNVKLGSTNVTVKKIAYAESSFEQTIGLGSNQLSQAKLTPVGAQFSFEIFDWLSNQPIDKAEVTFEQSSAVSSSDGKAQITIEPTDDDEIELTITAKDYREQKFKLNTLSQDVNKIGMKVGQPHFFISSRSGKYDLYKTWPDEEPEMVVPGTGSERDDLRFSTSPDHKYGVLVSTRDEVRNDDGFLLSGLYKVNLETSQVNKLDESEKIELVGWVDNKLVYVKIADGASGNNPNRHILKILDLSTDYAQDVASTNYFNDVVVTDNKIFYAPSDAFKQNPDTSLFKADSSGNITKVYDAEVWSISQTSRDEIVFDATGDWYSYSISGDSASAIDGPPSNRRSRIYVEGSDGNAIWIDQRDGKGVLLLDTEASNEDKTIASMSGLKYPVVWLNDKHIVFRVSNPEETADYIVNIDGGEAKKLTDVSNISGTDRWYYY